MLVQPPPVTDREAQRLASLRSLGILDTPREERFDRIVRLAQRLFDTPVAYVSLIDEDRQWFKARIGFAAPETPKELSFCAHAIAAGPEVFVVSDLTLDARFSENPIVKFDPSVRFYAGAPIAAPDGELLGTLCVLDQVPRELSDDDVSVLRDLAEMVESEVAGFHLAVTDELTGLVNRKGYERLTGSLEKLCADHDLPATVIFLDLDNMKTINDTHGHDAGDEALIRVGKLMRKAFRASDLMVRYGGDEFCVVLTGAAAEDAVGAVERFETLVHEWNSSGAPIPLSVSAGRASAGGADVSIADLTRAADEAMYKAKAAKKAER